MPPGRKRTRIYTPEEVLERDTMDVWQPSMDSDSESEESSSSDSETDEPPPSPTRTIPRNEEENDALPVEPDFPRADSDSEVDDADEGEQPEENDDDEAVWIDLVDQDWSPTWYNKYNESAKLLFDITENMAPINFFYQYFPENLFTHIAEETNRYADECIGARRPLQKNSSFHKWTPTQASEMKAFTGLEIAMGLVSKPAKALYWEGNWLTGTPGFSTVLSSNRFQLLDAFLHLNNNNLRVPRGEAGYDPLFKVRPIMEAVLPTYRASYSPGCDLSIDESLIPFKGRVGFKQYLPLKPKKWGLKFFVVCDASNGFCLDWKAYTGREPDVPANGELLSTRVVKELVEPYFGSGRSIFTDSFYSSPDLFQQLKSNNIGACGTVRLNRRGMPVEMCNVSARQRKGDPPASFRKGQLMATTWHDTKRVSVLSTIHGSGTVQKEIRDRRSQTGRRTVQKPKCVDAYNKAMGGVDLLDQRMSYYRYPHRHMKWYFVMYHFIIEVALVNAFLSYRLATKDQKMTVRKFRLEVVNSLCSGHRRQRDKGRPKVLRERDRANIENERLTGRHFCVKNEVLHYRPDCIVCSARGRRKQTMDMCRQCQLPMCRYECFIRYHTLQKYK